MTELFIPSPAQGVWHLGPIPIRAYALSVLAGIVLAWFVTRARWRARGGDVVKLENLMLGTIVCGIVGARLYFVLIEWPRYFGPDGTWYHMFFIWNGGLGILGGVTVGALGAFLLARHYGFRFSVLADCIAPALPLAQAIGRFGNWWNQELYGRPTTLPWGLEIDMRHRVDGYEGYATFHPTFLYEMTWDLAVAAFLVFVGERRLRLGRGKLFASYLVCYAIGRLVVESFRIDPVHEIAGLRINSWATIAFGLAGVIWLVWLLKNRPGPNGPNSAATPDAPADGVADGPDGGVGESEAEAGQPDGEVGQPDAEAGQSEAEAGQSEADAGQPDGEDSESAEAAACEADPGDSESDGNEEDRR
jgi:prolipoprotein diacylglyceryl transferase